MKATARCRPSVGRKLAECYEVRRNRDDSSNPTASSGVDQYQTEPCKPSVIWRPSATRKTTRFGVRDAKYNAAFRHAPSQHGRYRTPKQFARNAKNPGKTRVLQHGLQKTSGEDRNRTFGCFLRFFGVVRNAPYGCLQNLLTHP